MSSMGNFTVIRRKGSARCSMVFDSGKASLAGLVFLVRTLREDASFLAGLFAGMSKTTSASKMRGEKRKCPRGRGGRLV